MHTSDAHTHAADPRIEFFDRNAPTWDTAGPPAALFRERLSTIDDLRIVHPGHTVIETGCGTGEITRWLIDRVGPTGHVTAIDFSPEMLRIARTKNLAADFLQLDLCNTMLPPASCDVVFCFNCFPHLRNQIFALRNFAQALRPNGKIILLHLESAEKINAFHAQLPGHVRHDRLPIGDQWPPLLTAADLSAATHIDRDDLFLLIAEPQRPS